MLSIDNYNRAEASARLLASYPAIRAFTPGSFLQANFPVAVSEEIEIRKFVDIMYELMIREDWLENTFYSELEAQAINRLSRHILVLTEKLFDRAVQPLMCLFPPWPLIRVVEEISRVVGRKLRIFESGCGAGYLGAYLIGSGHQYVGMDVCQSLYLWQNRLFGSLARDFAESATTTSFPSSVTALVTHLPWWHFAKFHEVLPFEADVIICDAALSEMDQFALRYLVMIAKKMLSQSEIGCFIFQSTGEPRVTPRVDVEGLLEVSGFHRHIIGDVSMFTCSNRFPIDASLTQPPHLGDRLGRTIKPPLEFFQFDETKLLESYRFFEAMGLSRRYVS